MRFFSLVRMPQEKPLQGIPKKICAAKIFWEEEQQVYKSKRRIAARKNYLVATSAAIRGFLANMGHLPHTPKRRTIKVCRAWVQYRNFTNEAIKGAELLLQFFTRPLRAELKAIMGRLPHTPR